MIKAVNILGHPMVEGKLQIGDPHPTRQGEFYAGWSNGIMCWLAGDALKRYLSGEGAKWTDKKGKLKKGKRNGRKKKVVVLTHKQKSAQAEQKQNHLLGKFWSSFGVQKDCSCEVMQKRVLARNVYGGEFSKEDKLNLLIQYSEIKLKKRNGDWLNNKRVEFNKKKVDIHGMRDELNQKCFVCLKAADCRHHIIQLQNGGQNSKKNLVSLCNSCHSEIHPWMKG